MSVEGPTDAIKRKLIPHPTWSEVGHILQGCGIGVIIGEILSDVHSAKETFPIVFFCLITIGGFIINFNRKT